MIGGYSDVSQHPSWRLGFIEGIECFLSERCKLLSKEGCCIFFLRLLLLARPLVTLRGTYLYAFSEGLRLLHLQQSTPDSLGQEGHFSLGSWGSDFDSPRKL